jgi:hypothetical protein
MYAKKGFGEIIILVFAILLAILMGVVMIVILKDLQDPTPITMQHASGDAVYSKVFHTYLSLPANDPRGLQLADYLLNNEKNQAKQMLQEFVTTNIHPEACWEFLPVGISHDTGSCNLERHIPFESLEIKVDLPVRIAQTYTLKVT